MAKYVNMICVHPTRVHRARALHRWWIFRTSSRRSRSPRSHRISLLWAASRHMCVLVFLCFVFLRILLSMCPLVSFDSSCAHSCGPQAHLFDRRHAGRYLRAEWGMPPDEESATTCVRRFGRRSRAKGEKKGYEHITGARMSAWNGHEVCYHFCLRCKSAERNGQVLLCMSINLTT